MWMSTNKMIIIMTFIHYTWFELLLTNVNCGIIFGSMTDANILQFTRIFRACRIYTPCEIKILYRKRRTRRIKLVWWVCSVNKRNHIQFIYSTRFHFIDAHILIFIWVGSNRNNKIDMSVAWYIHTSLSQSFSYKMIPKREEKTFFSAIKHG